MGGTYYEKFDARVGIVSDSILFDSLKSAATFIYIPPTGDWHDLLTGLDLLLIVSTWRGLGENDWLGVGRVGHDRRKTLMALIDEARTMRIPTVFYSKEDPPNYEVFLDFAKRCDSVFTSAEEKVEAYRSACGHERVYVLPFCVDPELQNPVGCRPFQENGGAIFSGSWMQKYPFRCRDLAALLDGVLKTRIPLTIVDRNSFRATNPGYRFPRRFTEFLWPALQHDQLQALHRSNSWSLNVNSVTTSASMFAGRCYELLACGCPIISNFSVGMLNLLPEIAIADTPAYVKKLISGTTLRQMQLRRAAGIRRVMTGETCYDRVGAILKAVGIKAEQPKRSVLVVVPEKTPDVLAAFASQTYADRELCLAADCDEAQKRRFAYVAEWLTGETYGPFYLQDLVDAFKYTDADFVTDCGGYYESVDEPKRGHTVFRTACSSSTKGFAVPVLNETKEEVDKELARAHEIVRPVVRSLASVRPPLWIRAYACYCDNGLMYTIRRILFGRQY